MVLVALESLQIRAIHSQLAHSVSLRGAVLEGAENLPSGRHANNVEICMCPANYIGDSCQVRTLMVQHFLLSVSGHIHQAVWSFRDLNVLSGTNCSDFLPHCNDIYQKQHVTKNHQQHVKVKFSRLFLSTLQKCAPGFYRDTIGLFLGKCVPCNCNGHSEQCLDGSGICVVRVFVVGNPLTLCLNFDFLVC